MRWLVAALACLCLALPGAAGAWGRAGHHVICTIAWEQTSADGRAFVAEVLAVGDADGFARLCAWADEVRRTSGYGWTGPHHYLNAKRARPLDPRADCPPDGCVLRALGQQARLFEGASGSRRARADALKFIAHYVGDLHQPLHVGYGEDAGGNDIAVRFCPRSCWSSVDNLHQVWDSAILKAGSPSKDRVLAKQLGERIGAKERAAWRKGDVVVWARETYAIAADSAYQTVKHGKPSGGYLGDRRGPAYLGPDYTEVMRPVALEQLQKAAVRLALVLDALARGGAPSALTVVPSLAVTPAKSVSSYTVVRSAANSSAEIIGRLAVGERAELLGREKSWYRIRLGDRREGYVRARKVLVL